MTIVEQMRQSYVFWFVKVLHTSTHREVWNYIRSIKTKDFTVYRGGGGGKTLGVGCHYKYDSGASFADSVVFCCIEGLLIGLFCAVSIQVSI